MYNNPIEILKADFGYDKFRAGRCVEQSKTHQSRTIPLPSSTTSPFQKRNDSFSTRTLIIND